MNRKRRKSAEKEERRPHRNQELENTKEPILDANSSLDSLDNDPIFNKPTKAAKKKRARIRSSRQEDTDGGPDTHDDAIVNPLNIGNIADANALDDLLSGSPYTKAGLAGVAANGRPPIPNQTLSQRQKVARENRNLKQ